MSPSAHRPPTGRRGWAAPEGVAARARPASVAVVVATLAWRLRERLPAAVGGPRAWDRTNHRGAAVSLLEGPALAAGAVAGVLAGPAPARVRAGAALATTTAAVLGAVDDLAGSAQDRGLRGHLGALAHGRLTTGGLKVLGIGVGGLLAGAVVDGPGTVATGSGAVRGTVRGAVGGTVRGTVADRLVAGALVAGSANLVNLLDLRPGRAAKAVVVLGHLLGGLGVPGSRPAAPVAAPAAAAAAALLGPDLREEAMLGDCGANAAGALLGTALLARTRSRAARAAVLTALLGLTLASERVSFSRVIASTPVLRELDRLGRLPVDAPPPAP